MFRYPALPSGIRRTDFPRFQTHAGNEGRPRRSLGCSDFGTGRSISWIPDLTRNWDWALALHRLESLNGLLFFWVSQRGLTCPGLLVPRRSPGKRNKAISRATVGSRPERATHRHGLFCFQGSSVGASIKSETLRVTILRSQCSAVASIMLSSTESVRPFLLATLVRCAHRRATAASKLKTRPSMARENSP